MAMDGGEPKEKAWSAQVLPDCEASAAGETRIGVRVAETGRGVRKKNEKKSKSKKVSTTVSSRWGGYSARASVQFTKSSQHAWLVSED